VTLRAPAFGWGVLLAATLPAAFGPIPVQLGFAGVTVGMVGLAHGASDLAIVKTDRRGAFLWAYVLVTLVCLAWWIAASAVALPAFLLASGLHFGLEDAPADRPLERLGRGISLVATPATLHIVALTNLLSLAGLPKDIAPALVEMLAIAGGAAAAGLVWRGIARADRRLIIGTVALLLLPPLIGFSLGFLILHALPQTTERRVRLGCATTAAYLRETWPILLAAVILICGIVIIVLRWDSTGVRSLFAALAALAMPHLLVTPWFEQPMPRLGQATAAIRSS
jgi:Brp/Blh family beta-carotene 15,15'-monooxygenase